MDILNITEFINIINNNKTVLLCGNGFSMNFDNRYSNIYKNFYACHKKMIHDYDYKVVGGTAFQKALKGNFNSVIKYIKYISENKYYGLFDDCVKFASSILNDKNLIKSLNDANLINNLTFGVSQLDLLESICKVSDSRGNSYVNIEHWTILVYFYYAIIKVNPTFCELIENNSFLTLVRLGNSNSSLVDKELDCYGKSLINGFLIYYRFIVAYTVCNDGKSISFDGLDDLDNLNLKGIEQFLSMFNTISTTNYDLLMEYFIEDVIHLHGKFVTDIDEYVFNQSLSATIDNKIYSFSDITIGDYFLFKTFLPITNNFMKGSNKKILKLNEQFKEIINKDKASVLVIFGLSIDNDQHILRNYILELFNGNIDNAQIIYCYFRDEEREAFIGMFQRIITFRADVNEYCNSIRLSFIKTQDILEVYFQDK